MCLCDERMASGSSRLNVLLCGCAAGLWAVCSFTRLSVLYAAERTGVEEGGAGETGETREEQETGIERWNNEQMQPFI